MAETLTHEEFAELLRKEKKDLMAKIQKMKHSVPNTDKKKKKEVAAQITQMLSDFDINQEEQLKNYEAQHLINKNLLCEGSNELSKEKNGTSHALKEDTEESEIHSEKEVSNTPNPSQKISKAQKRRNKKVQQQKEREKAIAEQEIDNLTGLRHIESMKINQKLSERGLAIYEIPSDGNCLYKAIEHQLSVLNLQKFTTTTLRDETSKYLLSHKEEYLPFLTHPETGDILSDEQFEKYCNDIVNTPAWGGHIEIKILSCICRKPIEVIQGDGPSVVVGEENAEPKLIISYHRYVYGLGEHYNSTIPGDKISDTASNVK